MKRPQTHSKIPPWHHTDVHQVCFHTLKASGWLARQKTPQRPAQDTSFFEGTPSKPWASLPEQYYYHLKRMQYSNNQVQHTRNTIEQPHATLCAPQIPSLEPGER